MNRQALLALFLETQYVIGASKTIKQLNFHWFIN